MGKMNKKSTPNKNVSSNENRFANYVSANQEPAHEFSEELADGGERNEIITKQQNK